MELNKQMQAWGESRSVIRDLFEYGLQRKAEIGADKVFDFSLGNPSVPAPPIVAETIAKLQEGDPVALHGYTSAAGDLQVRHKIAYYLNKNYGLTVGAQHLYMTCGAAASLTISLKALCLPGDEVVVCAPFFPEYRVFVEAAGAKLVQVQPDAATLYPDAEAFAAAITAKTKAVIINSPNNPSGVVYPEWVIKGIAGVLTEKQAEYGHDIVLISDEPYRELVYGNVEVPYILNYYDNSIVCYSFSKSLSLPGERIGFILVGDKMSDGAKVYAAICGAARALGYVCAPSLFQRVVAEALGQTADVSIYRYNRDLLLDALTEYGFSCVQPDGAFYLFMRTPEPDAVAFCERAKKHELLLVPCDGFGTPGFVRISYCVSTKQIENSLPAFKALAAEYK
ncbi:MAG: pyridoxal phosphate-dependent aminotransferase [Firmicutes bacterium]|nr:pyridoxal phosphate-dependent aminotransferase [Bacillota bacterium]